MGEEGEGKAPETQRVKATVGKVRASNPASPALGTFFFSRFRSFLSITPRICFMASVWTAPVPVAGCCEAGAAAPASLPEEPDVGGGPDDLLPLPLWLVAEGIFRP